MAELKQLDAAVELRRVEFVGPQVGKELFENGALALLFVSLGIVAYLSLRFEWKFGVSAIIANLHDVVIILGFFSLFQWEFSLPVLAAVLAVLGYSVNESVVVIDRVRENFRNRRFRSMTDAAGDRPRDHRDHVAHHHHARLHAAHGVLDADLRRRDAVLLRARAHDRHLLRHLLLGAGRQPARSCGSACAARTWSSRRPRRSAAAPESRSSEPAARLGGARSPRFIDIVLHLDRHLQWLVANYGVWIYAILFAIIFCETGFVVTPFLPGDSLLFVAGALAAGGRHVHPRRSSPLLAVASFLGRQHELLDRPLRRPAHLHARRRLAAVQSGAPASAPQRFYEKYGGEDDTPRALHADRAHLRAVRRRASGACATRRSCSTASPAASRGSARSPTPATTSATCRSIKQNLTLVILAIVLLSISPAIVEFVRHRYAKAERR